MNSRIVVAAVIRKGDYLLFGTKEKDRGPYPNTDLILGGGVDLDKETLHEAILREIKEEAGIEVSIIKELGFDEDYEPDKNNIMTHYLFITFLADYVSGEIKPNDDIKNLKWVHKKDIQNLRLNRPTIKLFKKLGII